MNKEIVDKIMDAEEIYDLGGDISPNKLYKYLLKFNIMKKRHSKKRDCDTSYPITIRVIKTHSEPILAPQRIPQEYLDALRELEQSERRGTFFNWFILVILSCLIGVLIGALII